MRIASLLVGNELPLPLLAGGPRGDAGLEITFMGPTLKFTEAAIFAVAGGAFLLKLDGADIPMYQAIAARAGQVLDFGMVKDGARGDLAVAGGIAVAPVLGSRSENLFASRGPLGRTLKASDVLPVGPAEGRRAGTRFDLAKLPPRLAEPVLRVVIGPQDDLFTEQSLLDFQTQPWTLGTQANRTGLRFRGPVLTFRERPAYPARDAGADSSNIVDDVIPVGGIQCPSGIEAIVMGMAVTPAHLDEICDVQGLYQHGSIWRAHPVAMAVVIANIRAMEDEAVLANVAALEAHWAGLLGDLARRHPIVREVRGAGLMHAMELTRDGDSGAALTEGQISLLVRERIPAAFRATGALFKADNRGGAMIVLCPPLNVDAETLTAQAANLDRILTLVADDIAKLD